MDSHVRDAIAAAERCCTPKPFVVQRPGPANFAGVGSMVLRLVSLAVSTFGEIAAW